MTRVEREIEIAAAPEAVFAALADPDAHPRWRPAVETFRLLGEPPLGLGSRIEEIVRYRGKEYRSLVEVERFEPPRAIAFRALEAVFPFTLAAFVEPAAGGSRFRFVLDFERPRFLGVPVPFFGVLMGRSMQEEAEGLKELVEPPSAARG
jgi:uncharacterized protein YndB with AHSA1/START domain